MRIKITAVLFVLIIRCCQINARYVEGVLKSSEKWAFLARFCFLSDEGQFEYQIEYNDQQGDLNLLLYYDTDDQWPAVYKSNKTCEERERVLNIGQNQIVNLTTRNRYKDLSGCGYMQEVPPTSRTITITMPTLRPFKTNKTVRPTVLTTIKPNNSEFNIHTSGETPQMDQYSTIDSSSDYTTEKMTVAEEATTSSYSLHPFFSTLEEHKEPSKSKNSSRSKRSIPLQTNVYQKRRMVSCHNARRFRSSRERWWFIAISNCKGSEGINVKYRILMTNGPPGDYWHEHFSADEFYILPVLMAFSIAYSFLLLAIVMCSVELKSRQLLHTTYKIFVFSVVLQLFGVLFISSCYLKVAVSGLFENKIKRFGLILMGASETIFLLLLLLMAKGYTITRGRLPLPASVKLTIFMCLYVVTYISIFVYEAEVFDPGEVLYLYESPAGYGLIILRILAWCMFVYSTIFTLKHYPEKGNFYYPFNIFGTIWFVAGPAFIISANTYIDKWVRESVVCAVLLLISFGGHLMFLLLTMPSVANKNFPYHVRTTQIGVIEITGNAGASTMEQFSHHVYEPSTTIREQTVIIPLTKRMDMFEGSHIPSRRESQRYNEDHDNEHFQNSSLDTALGNVLKWSLVKNVPAIELPNFDRFRNRTDSDLDHSRLSDNSSLNCLSRNSSFNNKDQATYKFNDYVGEVPIELFTVSKMVVTTNGFRKTNSQDSLD